MTWPERHGILPSMHHLWKTQQYSHWNPVWSLGRTEPHKVASRREWCPFSFPLHWSQIQHRLAALVSVLVTSALPAGLLQELPWAIWDRSWTIDRDAKARTRPLSFADHLSSWISRSEATPDYLAAAFVALLGCFSSDRLQRNSGQRNIYTKPAWICNNRDQQMGWAQCTHH